MKKRLISMLLTLCMIATLIPVPAMAAAFDDTAGHWAKPSIERLSEKNIVRGALGKFRPDDTITRAEVAQIFDNLMDYKTATDKTFSDLPKDAWYAGSMKKAVAAGVFAGGGNGTLNPLGQISRQEFFVTLARVLQLSDSTKAVPFSDVADIADWALPKVGALTEAGLLQGVKNKDGSFAAMPLKTISRAEVITMLDRAFPGIYNSADTYTQPVTGNAVVSKPGVKLDGVKVSGDLFIAPGVANGEVTLHNVKVAGRTLVYGGGKNSLLVNGETALNSLTAAKKAQEDPLTIKLFDKSTVKTITIVAGSAQTTIIVNQGATLDRLVIENEGTEVKGDGTVKVIVVTANNAVITVPNAKIEVAPGVTGTMVGGKPVAGGTTVTSNSTGTGTKRPSGGGSDPVGPVEPPQPAGTYAVRFETNGGEAIAPIYVVKNLKLDPVPQAAKKDNLFLGWYTDAALTTQFFASEVLTKDVTLYAKYEAIEKKQEQKVDSFALSEVMPAQTFTVSAPNMTPEQVRNAITVTNVGAGGTPELKITAKGDGTFTVSADGGFRTGSAVTLHLSDGVNFAENDKEGNPMSSEIRNASFTVKKETANNMELNKDLTRVKIDPAVVTDIVAPVQNAADGTITTHGSFTVIGDKLGDKTLAQGEMYVLYENVAPEARTDINADYSTDTIIYAKIKTVDSDNNPANGNQVVYDVVDDRELMNMPESLPLDVADFVAASYTGKDDLNFEIANTTLTGYWKEYDHIGLSATTTIDVGDTIILMGVGIAPGVDVETDNVVYGTVASVATDGTNTTVTFTLTNADKIMENKQDFYSKQDVDYSEIAAEATKKEIPAQIEKQAMESGFVEEAMTYLTEVATQTEGFKAVASRAGPSMDIGVPGFGDGWEPNVSLPKSLAKGFTVRAKITDKGDHYGGLMCQLYVEGKVEIPTDPKAAYPDKLVIDMKATFEQELKISVNMDGGIEWSWAGPIPYPSDIYVNTNVDVYDYTAIKVQAQVTTKGGSDVLHGALEGIKDVDISKEIQELLEMTDGDAQMAGTEKLFEMYGAMLETETDYITLVEQEIFNQGGTYYGILAYGVKGDFVIAANVNLVIGSSLEYESGNRYNFWFKLFSGTSGSSTTRLIDEQMKFQFYIMGTIGLKVGISLEIFVAISPGGKCNLASIGFGVDVGAYVDLYGYFVYEVKSLNQVTTSEMAGALYVDFGIYLEIYFFARAGEDIAGGLAEYQPTLFDKKWPLISAGEKINVYDFTYPDIPATEKYIIKNYTTDYLPDSYWSMKGMDLIAGDLVDLIYPRDRFVYTLSNPAFKFDVKEGKVTVTVPTNTRYMECDMTIKWAGAKLAFSTEDLVRTVHLVWTNLADEEMSLRHNISVVADGKVIWSKVVGEGEQYELPNTEKLKELLEYDKFMYNGTDLKYDTAHSTLTYKNEQGTNAVLNADRDRIYTVDVTPRVYELPIAEVQTANGDIDTGFVLTGKFGENLDLTPLLDSGTSNGAKEKPYTVYARTECVEKVPTTPAEGQTAPVGRPLDTPIDVGFAKQILDKTFTYTAQYNDNFVTATYHFMDSRGKILGTTSVKVEMDSYPDFDYQAYALNMVDGKDYMVKRFDKNIEKLTADETYSATCVLATGKAFPIVFGTGDEAVTVDSVSRHNGAHLTLPRPQRDGYTFAGWYEDELHTTPFTKTNMVTPPAPDSTDEAAALAAAKTAATTAATADTEAKAALATATTNDTNAKTAVTDATTADDTAKSELATATTADTDAKAAVVTAQGVLDLAKKAVADAGESASDELKKAVTDAETALGTKTSEATVAAAALIEKTAAAKTAADTLTTKTAEAATAATALTDANTAATNAATAKIAADNAQTAAQEAFNKADATVLQGVIDAAQTVATNAATADTEAKAAVTAAQGVLDAANLAVTEAGAGATEDQKNAVIAALADFNTKTGLATDAATAKTNADKVLADAQKALADATVQILYLYANWTPNVYYVTFDANAPGANVTGTPDDTTVTFGGSYGKLRDLHRSGYKFDGWSTETSGDVVGTVTTPADHVLYAQWTMKKVISDKYFTNFANTKDDGTGDVTVTVPYNKEAHPYLPVKADGADAKVELDSFIVQYKGKNPNYSANRWLWFAEKDENGQAVEGKQNVGPIDSEQYDVMLYRAEDAEYQMYKRVVVDGVVINKINRPAGVTITLPTKAITATSNTVTVDEATATSTVPGADAGTMLYKMETWQQTLEGTIVREETKLDQTDVEWTDSRTLQSKIENTPDKVIIEDIKNHLVRRIYVKLGNARNYNDVEASGYLTVSASEPLKNPGMADMSLHLNITTGDGDYNDTKNVVKWAIYNRQDVHISGGDLKEGFGKGTTDNFDRPFTGDPWSLKGTFYLQVGGNDAWRYVGLKSKLTIPGVPAIEFDHSKANPAELPWELDTQNSKEHRFAAESTFNRTITSVGTFASWNGTHEVSEKSKGKISYGYDGKITDQYGTYDAYTHYDAPTLRVGTLDKNKNLVATPFADCISYSNYGIDIDEAKLYARMAAAELTTVTFTVKLDIPTASRTNAADDKMFIQTITVNRAVPAV